MKNPKNAREGSKPIDILDKELIDHMILFSFTKEYSFVLGENTRPSKTMRLSSTCCNFIARPRWCHFHIL